jgi:1-acyl-sn-glycerol-3-phosphate acyltransferase
VPHRILRTFLSVLLRLLWRPRVEGLSHVPRTGPVLIASNHVSFFDSVVLPLVIPRRVVFLAKAEYFEGSGVRGGLVKAWFEAIGAVPVRRGTHGEAMDSLELALAVLHGQGGFGIYPEGTRSRDGRLYRGRTGVAWLALASGAPIVPAGVVGSELVQPVGASRPRVLRVPRMTVRFAAPVLPAAYSDLPPAVARRRMTDDVMDAVGALTGQPRSRGYNATPPSPTA